MTNYNEELKLALKNISENKKDKAEEILKNILSKDDKNFKSCFYLGNIYSEKKNYLLSKKFLNKSIFIKPNFPEAYNSLGIVYFNLGNFIQAEQSLNKAIEINENIPDPYNNLGILRREQNKISSAKDFFLKAINKNNKYFPAYINLMELYERTNQNNLLEEIINKSEEIFNSNKITKLYKGKLNYKKKNYSDTIKILESLKFNSSEIIFEKARLLNLAKSYDKIKSFNNAFKNFKQMNDLSLSNLSTLSNKDEYNTEIYKRNNYFKSIKTIPWVETKLQFNQNPVFMIGFPRSGTTLLDSILRSHPLVEIIEEKPIIDALILSINKFTGGYIEKLNKLNDSNLKELQNLYFEKRESYLDTDSVNKIIIDKLPLNIVYIPEIIRIFPNSKFILSLRHPYDCILSCYFQNFKLNSSMLNFLKLEDSANFYNLVMQMWAKYNQIFKPEICELKYEDLIYSFEHSVRKVLNFLEIQWTDEIYNFNDNAKKRRITTPSYYQVTEPINSRAIDRWKNYELQIDKIKPIIKKWVNFYNY
tara:strand:- start:118 stop:1716 length:1599 start_codon:yes stop_codon:yes gene_type:complete